MDADIRAGFIEMLARRDEAKVRYETAHRNGSNTVLPDVLTPRPTARELLKGPRLSER